MQYLQIIAALLPILEQLIAAVEAASHPGSTVSVPPQASRLRTMVGDVRALIDASGGTASVQKAVDEVAVPPANG